MGTVLTDQRPEHSDGDGVIVVGRFKGGPYDGVQLSYVAGQRNLYLTPEAALRLAILLAAAAEAASPSHQRLCAACGRSPSWRYPSPGWPGARYRRRAPTGNRSPPRTAPGHARRRPGPGPAAHRAAGPRCHRRARPRSTRTPSARAYRGGTSRQGEPTRTRPADAIDQPAFGPFRRTTWLLRLRQQRLQHTAHCASLRSNRPVTARVATRSPDNWSSWSKNHLPETSLLIDERHTSTGRLPRILLNTA